MAGKQRSGGRSSGDRGTKAERREEARRRRVEIERRMLRARRNRRFVIGAAVLVVAIVAAFVVTRPKSEPMSSSAAKLLASAAAAEQSAGCTSVKDVGPYPESLDRAHIGAQGGPATMPALSSYPSVPPASGPHSPTPLDSGVYSSAPALDEAIHSLEHGAAIVWYDPNTSGAALSKIQSFYTDANVGSRVIVAPYDYPDQGTAGHLPTGVSMALVSWHHVETCTKPSLAAAFDFTARYASPPYTGEQYLGDAPEPGAPI